MYSRSKELQNLINWAIGFGHATGFYDSTTTELIHLASQELGIIPREENYVNPYRYLILFLQRVLCGFYHSSFERQWNDKVWYRSNFNNYYSECETFFQSAAAMQS